MNRLVALTLLGLSTFVLTSCTTDEAPQTTPPPPVVDDPPKDPPPPPTDGFPAVAEPCAEELDLFVRTVWVPTVSVKCTGCHNATGVAAATRLRLVASNEPEDVLTNYQMLGGAASVDADGTPLLLSKPTAQHADGHTGGAVLSVGSAAYEALEHFAHVATDPACNMERPPGPNCDTAEPSPRMIRRLTHEEYALTLVALFGETSTSVSQLVADPRVDGYANDASALVVSPLLADQYRTNAEAIAGSMVHKLNDFLPCSLADGEPCLRGLIAAFGERVFRRPLDDTEIERYLGIYRTAEPFGQHQALKWMIVAFLQSPNFVYRTEIGEPDPNDGLYHLTNDEIASAMSYFLTGAPPDEDLRRTAELADLSLPNRRAVEARRLLEKPEARLAMTRFFRQWLEVDAVRATPKDPGTFPELDDAVRRSMQRELEHFVEHVMGASTRTLPELLTADYTYVDPTLERFYGVLGEGRADPEGFRAATGDHIHGLLTQGSLLTVHASPDSTSPVLRGKLIRERFFCQELPPPPPGLDVDAPAVDPTQTQRERFAQHSEDAACSGCHRLVDPIGFAFEHYDGVGRYRRSQDGLAIDVSGEIVETIDTNQSFAGVGELAQILAESPDVHECLSEQWLRYGFGLAPETDELACTAKDATEALQAADLDLRALLVELVKSRHFEVRRAPQP